MGEIKTKALAKVREGLIVKVKRLRVYITLEMGAKWLSVAETKGSWDSPW